MNSTPAFDSAASIACTVLTRESTIPFSKRATALSDTIALSANCCWDHPRSARAARICRALITRSRNRTRSIIATYRVIIRLIRLYLRTHRDMISRFRWGLRDAQIDQKLAPVPFDSDSAEVVEPVQELQKAIACMVASRRARHDLRLALTVWAGLCGRTFRI